MITLIQAGALQKINIWEMYNQLAYGSYFHKKEMFGKRMGSSLKSCAFIK